MNQFRKGGTMHSPLSQRNSERGRETHSKIFRFSLTYEQVEIRSML